LFFFSVAFGLEVSILWACKHSILFRFEWPIPVADSRFHVLQSKVAVWALLQGATFFFLGLLCVIENLAASRKLITLRDQLRTLLLLTALFLVAWMIAGNVW
jgi:hypothetical protein